MIPGPIDRLRLALDALRGHGLGGHYTREEWVTCRCGKEINVFVREATDDMAELSMGLKRHSMCKACGSDMSIQMDMCPEALGVPGGVSMCTREWKHTGRCEPHPPPSPEMLKKLREQSA